MVNNVLLCSDISYDILTRYNYPNYEKIIKNFHTYPVRYEEILHNTFKELNIKDSYENRVYNNTTLLLFNDVKEDLMAYCSFCCSNVKSSDKRVYPAVEITTFALNKKYSGNVNVDLGDRKVKCSDYSLELCMSYFKTVQQNYIYACLVHLHSDTNTSVQNFYERNGFKRSNSYFKYLYDYGNNPEMYFFRTLDD